MPANDPTTLDQVIEFIVKLDDASVQQMSDQVKKIADERRKVAGDTEDDIADLVDKASDKRKQILDKELDEFEKKSRGKFDNEIDRLDRLIQANEDRYRKVVELARSAAEEQKIITTELNDEELRNLDQYERNREAILNKRAEQIKARGAGPNSFITKLSDEIGIGPEEIGPNRRVAAAGMNALHSSITGDDTGAKSLKLMGQTAEGMLTATSLLGTSVVLLGGILKFGQMAYEFSLQNAKETMTAIRGTGGVGIAMHENGFELLSKYIREIRYSKATTPEEAEAAPAVLNTLGRTRGGKGGIYDNLDSNPASVMQIIWPLQVVSDQLGMTFTELAKISGDAARQMNMPVEFMLAHISRIQYVGMKISQDLQDIDVTQFTKNVLEAAIHLKNYGFSVQDTTNLMSKFAVDIDRGLISLNDFTNWLTGASRADFGALTFAADAIASGKTGNTVLQGALSRISNPLERGVALKGLAENDDAISDMFLKQGKSPQDIRELQLQAQRAMTQVLSAAVINPLGGGGDANNLGSGLSSVTMQELVMGSGLPGQFGLSSMPGTMRGRRDLFRGVMGGSTFDNMAGTQGLMGDTGPGGVQVTLDQANLHLSNMEELSKQIRDVSQGIWNEAKKAWMGRSGADIGGFMDWFSGKLGAGPAAATGVKTPSLNVPDTAGPTSSLSPTEIRHDVNVNVRSSIMTDDDKNKISMAIQRPIEDHLNNLRRNTQFDAVRESVAQMTRASGSDYGVG